LFSVYKKINLKKNVSINNKISKSYLF